MDALITVSYVDALKLVPFGRCFVSFLKQIFANRPIPLKQTTRNDRTGNVNHYHTYLTA